jgi:hypothetical protein
MPLDEARPVGAPRAKIKKMGGVLDGQPGSGGA